MVDHLVNTLYLPGSARQLVLTLPWVAGMAKVIPADLSIAGLLKLLSRLLVTVRPHLLAHQMEHQVTAVTAVAWTATRTLSLSSHQD